MWRSFNAFALSAWLTRVRVDIRRVAPIVRRITVGCRSIVTGYVSTIPTVISIHPNQCAGGNRVGRTAIPFTATSYSTATAAALVVQHKHEESEEASGNKQKSPFRQGLLRLLGGRSRVHLGSSLGFGLWLFR